MKETINTYEELWLPQHTCVCIIPFRNTIQSFIFLLMQLELHLSFIFSMTFTFLGCFFHRTAAPWLRDFTVAHTNGLHLHIGSSAQICIFTAMLHITLGCRLELPLARVRLGQGVYLGLLWLNVFLKQLFSHAGVPIPADVMVLFHSRSIPGKSLY